MYVLLPSYLEIEKQHIDIYHHWLTSSFSTQLTLASSNEKKRVCPPASHLTGPASCYLGRVFSQHTRPAHACLNGYTADIATGRGSGLEHLSTVQLRSDCPSWWSHTIDTTRPTQIPAALRSHAYSLKLLELISLKYREILWRGETISNVTCLAPTHRACATSGLGPMQCNALIRCPSDSHQAPFLCCVPGHWCELGYIPADGAITGRSACHDVLDGRVLMSTTELST